MFNKIKKGLNKMIHSNDGEKIVDGYKIVKKNGFKKSTYIDLNKSKQFHQEKRKQEQINKAKSLQNKLSSMIDQVDLNKNIYINFDGSISNKSFNNSDEYILASGTCSNKGQLAEHLLQLYLNKVQPSEKKTIKIEKV